MQGPWKDLLATRLRPLSPQGQADEHGDHDLNPHLAPSVQEAGDLRPAAVLVLIVDHDSGPTVLLTHRAAHLSTHAGQIAFPGGRVEPNDHTYAAAALRETQEEIGLAPEFVTLIGTIDTYITGTGFRIFPFVGVVRPGFSLAIDANEVAETFEVPLAFLMDNANHHLHQAVWRGQTRQYYVIPYERHEIWGATAGMIVNLHKKLGNASGAP